jgi:purine-binding chemotaxis protein CheW
LSATGAALVFASGAHVGALPIEHVQETMRPLPIEPVASDLPFLAGIAIVRGTALPVVNMEALLAVPRGATPRSRRVDDARSPVGRFITVRVDGRAVALAVTEVLGVWPAAALDTGALPPLLERSGAVAAIGRLDGRLLLVLEAASLVPPDAWSQLAAQRSAR